MLRRIFGLVLVGAVTAAALCDGSSDPTGTTDNGSSTGAPANEMVFDIRATGITYAGNTNFLMPTTQFTAVEQFSRDGTLLVARNTSEGGPGVGLAIGSVSAAQAGNTWFATHSSMLKVVPGSSSASRNAGLTVASVAFSGGRVEVRVITGGTGHPVSRTMQLNSFVWRSGLAAPKQILEGEMVLQLRENDRRVEGEAVFFGGGYIEPGTYAIAIAFEGVRR